MSFQLLVWRLLSVGGFDYYMITQDESSIARYGTPNWEDRYIYHAILRDEFSIAHYGVENVMDFSSASQFEIDCDQILTNFLQQLLESSLDPLGVVIKLTISLRSI